MDDHRSITIVKKHPGDEKPPLRYVGQSYPCDREGWFAFSCTWTFPDMVADGIPYETGAELVEYFSPTKLYNVFRVFDRAGEFAGLYCNVTAPLVITDDGGELIWEDRWLDAVKLPDGTISILDEDEYEATGIPTTNPALDREIRQALRELVESLSRGDWDR